MTTLSEPSWIDIGVNLTNSRFSNDRESLIEQAFSLKINPMIVTGTTLADSLAALELCQQYPEKLFCTAGVHPHYAKDNKANNLAEIFSLYGESAVVAIGETGLDFNRNFSSQEVQISVFEQHLNFATETGLPLFLHERDAHKQQLEMLRYYRDNFSNAVIHCFTGTKEALYNYLDLDLHIGITGWICDERRGTELQQLVKHIPVNRLMLETDAPYLLPRDLKQYPKDKRNIPAYLPHIAAKVAELQGKNLLKLSSEVWDNSINFFNLPLAKTALK